ncbi:MAG: 23S rRNA (adenine(2030)-N(6))-methyltransferase RlmJ [Proteobacteria bacterium]|nr:23S rRNA (adenine(2030)-N(6))-methyltransferase RlmJ [Pseudomonadota bacterium]
MNYRHAFHAGNVADVFKHAVLCRILSYLTEKQSAFRVIDTHAGAGLYDLSSAEAQRGGEWQAGIGRLMAAVAAGELPERAAALLKPYLDVIGALNERGALKVYPGSPALTRAFLRGDDRLIACEVEPKAEVQLERHLRHDGRIKVIAIDGWTAMTAYVPPPERRGLVLVDPPFEEEADFHRLSHTLGLAHRKWPTGIYALWYPIKGRGEADALAKRVRKLGIAKVLRAELLVSPVKDQSRLNGSGLIVINPPWTLEGDLQALLPVLARLLAREPGSGSVRIDWLAREAAPTAPRKPVA